MSGVSVQNAGSDCQSSPATDLEVLRIEPGDAVLIHNSWRWAPDEATGVLAALRSAIGASGTLMVPAFSRGSREFPGTGEMPLPEVDPFAGMLISEPGAYVSSHPVYAFAAIGANAKFITRDAPFHYPLGTGSPLAKLHQLNGKVMLLGGDYTINDMLYLAEIWADAPYAHRQIRIAAGGELRTMRGAPGCNRGFRRLEPILHQARLIRSGSVHGAPAHVMRARAVVSMALALLKGDGRSLLCGQTGCVLCASAARMLAPQQR